MSFNPDFFDSSEAEEEEENWDWNLSETEEPITVENSGIEER